MERCDREAVLIAKTKAKIMKRSAGAVYQISFRMQKQKRLRDADGFVRLQRFNQRLKRIGSEKAVVIVKIHIIKAMLKRPLHPHVIADPNTKIFFLRKNGNMRKIVA